MSKTKTGQCMCGAVTFTVANAPASFGACHCETCRRWTGSALMGFNVPETDIAWKGEAHIKTLQSSDWAERAWCQRCGSSLYYRMTVDGPMAGSVQISLGLLDDLSGMSFDHELFVDCQPDAISYAGEGRDVMTRAQVFEKYGSGDDL